MKTIFKYMVEYVSNKMLHTELFDTEAEARKYVDDLYNECLLSASVIKVVRNIFVIYYYTVNIKFGFKYRYFIEPKSYLQDILPLASAPDSYYQTI
jgi:hypothetical protein